MARFLLLVSIFFCAIISVSAQTSISGQLLDDSGEPVSFANVILLKGGDFVTGTDTDLDGYYSISPIDPGTYDIKFSFVGFTDNLVTGVYVEGGKDTEVNSVITEGVTLGAAIIIEHIIPIFEKDQTASGGALSGDDIANLPSKSINGLASQIPGIASADDGDALAVRGSRSDGTFYYIDGIRVSGNLIPQTEIEQLNIITGGIGAKYGDVTGGVISITTKGPSRNFGGGIELETSEIFDNYGYNLISGYVNGPIIKNKDDQTVLGFRVSGQYRHQDDDDPPAIDIYQLTDEARSRLESNPVFIRTESNSGTTQYLNAAEFYTDKDVEVLDYQPFEDNNRLDLTAKLDARLSDAINVSFTGTFSQENDLFTPGETSRTLRNSRVFNNAYNPYDDETRYRTFFRFRHRLGKSTTTNADGEVIQDKSFIKNVSYTLQAGLEKYERSIGDSRHEDNLFNYGYVGKWDVATSPIIEEIRDQNGNLIDIQHTGYNFDYVEGSYERSEMNPILANYNNEASGFNSIFQFPALNGFTFDFLDNIHGYFNNVGTVYNFSSQRNEQIFTGQGSVNFDLTPGGTERNKHSIEIGFLYEQRNIRRYDIQPRSLWTLARQLANADLNGVDQNIEVGTVDTPNGPVQIFGAGGGGAIKDGSFADNIRNIDGVENFEYVNVDAFTPEQLSLDMFLADELSSQNSLFLDYYGHTYTGEEFDGTFNEFFTARDEFGNLTRPVAPFTPIYIAGYIQDKFKFKDLIVRAGLRVDRYDANTKVLKDPYSLYDILSAGEYDSQFGTSRPSTIGEDFKVYRSDATSDEIKAYRDGDQWYFSSGATANSGADIFGGTQALPYLINSDANIKDDDFVDDLDNSFEDYDPQVNLMPRLAFSFPISEQANFFAHYDILVQRPPRNNFAGGLDYLLFNDRDLTANFPKANSNLRPEKTIDYEVGFQQKLTERSALKVSAYYKELRDMIQLRIYQNIPSITNYYTYDNLDFGTVKGFTFTYDLRRTGNIRLLASYTLQFAEGTGSDANSSRGLGSREVLRTLYPFSYDERHRFNVNIDYRYRSGKEYNGPELFGKQIFANAGASVQLIAVSGRPYTAKTTADNLDSRGTKGQINGARLPWNNTVNLRIDKDFQLRKPKKDGGNGLNMNVYLRIANLFDTQNIISVYEVTGSPSTNGFLESAQGQQTIAGREVTDPAFLNEFGSRADGFVSSYQWRVANPNFFSLPRRMYLGVIFDF